MRVAARLDLWAQARAQPADFVDVAAEKRAGHVAAPSSQELAAIGVGCTLEIGNKWEKFWTHVVDAGPPLVSKSAESRKFLVYVDGLLKRRAPYMHGDFLVIRGANVISIRKRASPRKEAAADLDAAAAPRRPTAKRKRAESEDPS